MTAKTSRTKRPRYVLIIEDNVHHAEILTEVLDKHFAPVVIHTVDTLKDGLEFVSQSSYDLILTGGIIKDLTITEWIPKLCKFALDTPIIVISGRGDERLAADIIKHGASEYLVKTKETLELLPELLNKYLKNLGKKRSNKSSSPKSQTDRMRPGRPSPESIIREVDKLSQQALTIVGGKRRKHVPSSQNSKQLDELLGQIKRLRELASKLSSG